MRNTITKTVSLMLVTVIVLGIAVMPMRASAGLESLTPVGVWLKIIDITQDIAKQMLNPINNSPNTSAISRFSAFFEPTLQDDLLYVTAEQMNELSYWLVQNGISVMPTSVPGRNLIALCVQDTSVFIPAIDTTIQLDVNVGDMYTYSGKTIVRIPGGSAAEEDRDSYTGNGSTSNNVGIGDDGQLVDVPTTDKDTGTTVGGGTFIHNETTNNWQVKNENGTYVDINGFHYNPVTQTYHTTTNEWNSTTNNYDNRSYTYQFYYDYTYITYIGSSAEYREAYKVYYELPDGRSSGDLTVDDLKGISLQFDMVNYDKASSDTLTQILLPFDGSLDNTSYFDASSSFLTSLGYSFLESPDPFGGSLFLPISNGSGSNQFICDLNSSFSPNQSFTVQGRFYLDGVFSDDTSTTSNVIDSVSFGVVLYDNSNRTYLYLPFFRVQENTSTSTLSLYCNFSSNTYSNSGFTNVPLSTGLWHDFCAVFDSSSQKVYFYLNGSSFPSRDIAYLSTMYMVPFDGVTPFQSDGFNTGVYWREDFSLNFRWTNLSLLGVGFHNGGKSCPIRVDNLRLVSAPLYTGSSASVPQAPFDTNLAYVLPSVAELNDNTVAIMSQLPVTGYRVGGIRPTDPTLAAGYVWMHIDGDFVDSVQQWNGAYWEEVTARLYTGVRWIPVTAFNVFTLEDMFDIVDPDGDGGGESVSTIYQYYLWWSGEWGTFQQWLQGTMETLIEAIQNSGSGSGGPVTIVPGYNDQTTTNEITTENPDGSTTVTTIVSNAAGLVYSRSVTTWPPDAEGNVTTREVYTDSSGVMYQTTIITDKDGNVTITEPSEATGTLASIFKTITQGVMSIATTVIEAFVDLLVELVGFVLDSVGRIFTGITNILATLLSAITSFVAELGAAAQFLPAFFSILPAPIQSGFTLIFVGCVAIGLFRLIHF